FDSESYVKQIYVWTAADGMHRRITVDENGYAADFGSTQSSINYDGTKIAFTSSATNLNGAEFDPGAGWHNSVYYWDADASEITLISRSDDGYIGNSYSSSPSITADGLKVAFSSWATDLAGAHTAFNAGNIFLWHAPTQEIVLVTTGVAGNGANNRSEQPSISGDGAKVAFDSEATDIVGAPTTTPYENVFIWTEATNTNILVTSGPLDQGGNYFSGESSLDFTGDKIAFASAASDLVGAPTDKWDLAGTELEYLNVFLWPTDWPQGNTVDVTFDAQNSTSNLVVTIPTGSAVAQPTNPTKAGFTFAGWYTGPDGTGTLWNFGDAIFNNMTLYAYWVPAGGPTPTPTPNPAIPATGDSTMLFGLVPLALLGFSLVSSARAKRR
ncbi:MAG: InlB B-repeat-containing protein, partial [Actinomycetia bacterium]|nr:InlB B-repeat-containing protein [Actinomycetes bacterium]